MIWAVFGALALLLVAAAAYMLASASARERREALAERVGELGVGELVDEFAGLRNLQRIRNPITRSICHRFWGAGMDVKPATVNAGLVAYAVIGVLSLLVWPALGLVLLVAAPALAYLILEARVNARRQRILEQFPDYLEYVLRSLTAGNSLEEAIQAGALEATDPIRSLFLSVSRQVRLGATVEGTLGEAAEVHDLRALHILAMAARVNRRFGGSMRRVVKSLINTIRSQDAAGRELKALTGETRFSAWVVAAIPLIIGGLFYFSNPQYYEAMLASTEGYIALGVAVFLQALGAFLIWRMVASMSNLDL